MIREIERIINSHQDCFESLKEVAKTDSNNNSPETYITEIENRFINFDTKLRRKIFAESDELKYLVFHFSCVDTICILENKIYFLEFRNCTSIKNIEKKKKKNNGQENDGGSIKLKGIESILILFQFLKEEGMNINFRELLKLDINYFIIYNPNRDTDNEITNNPHRKFFGKKTSEIIEEGEFPKHALSGMDFYNKTYFSEVKILSVEKFEENYLPAFV